MEPERWFEALLAVWLSLFGLMIGSFLNVVIARLPQGQSVVRPRSRCPRCGHQLAWFENIPVVSWLALRGKCRDCRLPISLRYPAIELLTGGLYLACLVRFGWTLELAMALVLVSLLVPLTFIDLEHWILPFELTLPGIVTALLLSFLIGMDRFVASALGAAAGFFSFWLLEWVGEKIFKKEALGGGDKYLLAMLGAFLTYRPLLGLAFLASTQGAIVGSLLLWTRGRAGPAPKPPAAAPPAPALPPGEQTAEAAAPTASAPVRPTPLPEKATAEGAPHAASPSAPTAPHGEETAVAAHLAAASAPAPSATGAGEQTPEAEPLAATSAPARPAASSEEETAEAAPPAASVSARPAAASGEETAEAAPPAASVSARPAAASGEKTAEAAPPAAAPPAPSVPQPGEGTAESAAPSTEPSRETEDDWVPGPSNIPFGPWLALAAVELLLLAPELESLLPAHLHWFIGR